MASSPNPDPSRERAARLAAMPINAALGIEFARRSPGRAELSMPAREDQLQPDGVLHGGVLATLADTAAVYSIFPDLPEGRSITSIDFRLDFLRPVRPGDGPVTAAAEVIKVGRSVATAEVSLTQAGRLVARGTFVYLVLELPADAPLPGSRSDPD
jgi:uncharacterized protein (TIGR00369 family)